jgi:hypothetical protein
MLSLNNFDKDNTESTELSSGLVGVNIITATRFIIITASNRSTLSNAIRSFDTYVTLSFGLGTHVHKHTQRKLAHRATTEASFTQAVQHQSAYICVFTDAHRLISIQKV